MIIKRKLFTKYDETDSLKRMKDSDILAAKPKDIPTPSSTGLGVSTMAGALVGTGIGAGVGSVSKIANFRGNSTVIPKIGIKKAGKYGALIGAGYGAYRSLTSPKRNGGETVEDVEFYNRRLREAQKWAKRREKLDWKNNITNREGYSY